MLPVNHEISVVENPRLNMLRISPVSWLFAAILRGNYLLHIRRIPCSHRTRSIQPNFRFKTEWIGSIQPEKFGKNQSTFRGGPLSVKVVDIYLASSRLGKYPPLFTPTSVNYLTNRFHVAVRLFSNRSQMTSKCGKNKKVAHEAIAECVTDVLTTF